MKVFAKAMHVGQGRSVKVVLRYQEVSEEPVYIGTLVVPIKIWSRLRPVIRQHLTLEESGIRSTVHA